MMTLSNIARIAAVLFGMTKVAGLAVSVDSVIPPLITCQPVNS